MLVQVCAWFWGFVQWVVNRMGQSVSYWCFGDDGEGEESEIGLLSTRVRHSSTIQEEEEEDGASSSPRTVNSASFEEEEDGDYDDGKFGVLSIGVLGTGRSSFLNTLLNSSNACKVSGGQLIGTRGCVLVRDAQSKALDDSPELFMDFIDTEGLRSDKKVTEEEFQTYWGMISDTLIQFPGGKLSHILFTLDVEERSNEATISNLLKLTDLFKDVQNNCYLCLTKWNSNAVQGTWNGKLLNWCRKNKRKQQLEELEGDPPPPSDMLQDYREYVKREFKRETEQDALKRIETLLAFFQDRIIWAYNLDSMQMEDWDEGELPAHEAQLFRHYRSQAIQLMRKTSNRNVTISKLVTTFQH